MPTGDSMAAMTYDVLLMAVVPPTIWGPRDQDFYGLYVLATFLRDNGVAARVFVGDHREIENMLQREVVRRRIRLVGLACDYGTQFSVERLAANIKANYGLPVVVGGPQADGLGPVFLRRSGALAIVVGEGEMPLLRLCQHVLDGHRTRGEIPGIAFLDEHGQFVKNKPQPLLSDLDRLPMPDRSTSLDGGWKRQSFLKILTGRGCPFACSFCDESKHARVVRVRSVPRVLDEVAHYLEAVPSLRYLGFVDDTFTLTRERLGEFCRGLAKLRRERDFAWFCEGHVRLLRQWPGIVADLVAAGLFRLQIGIESGSQRLLDGYRKGVTPSEIALFVEVCRREGLPQLAANFLLGGPGETDKTLAESLQFARHLLEIGKGMLELRAGFLVPFPNSALAREPEAFGLDIVAHPSSRVVLDDLPVIVPHGMSRGGLAAWKHRFDETFKTAMESALPHLDDFAWFHHVKGLQVYGIESAWIPVLQMDEISFGYFSAIASGYACSIDNISAADLTGARPLRPLRGFTLKDDAFMVQGTRLDPVQSAVFELCTGKHTVGEIADLAGECHPELRRDLDGQAVGNVLREFSQRRWVTFDHPHAKGSAHAPENTDTVS